MEETTTTTPNCPPGNPDTPMQYINYLDADLNQVKTVLEGYAAHLRSLNCNRHGIGLRRQDFIERATEYAIENPELLPYCLTLEKLREDSEYFNSFNTLYNLAWQIQDLLWEITREMSDISYTNASEFYASVCKAAKRHVDVAESIYRDLEQFFKRRNRSFNKTLSSVDS